MKLRKQVLVIPALAGALLGSGYIISPAMAADSTVISPNIVKANEVLQAGTVLPATLLTTIVSDNMNTPIIAVIRQNIYDSVTGENLLIPAGSKVIGETNSFNGTRINVTFHRVIFPNGHSVNLPDYAAIDGVGQSGLKDKYTTHSWHKIRGIFTGSLLASALASISDSGRTRTTSTTSSTTTEDESPAKEAIRLATAEMLQTISDTTRDNAQIPPTGTVREGYQFNIMLGTDIRIRPYDE